MAQKWVNKVLEHSPQKGTAKLVLVAYAWKADGNGFCRPSNEAIAGICGITARQVRRAKERLISDGELVPVPEKNRGPYDTRKFRLGAALREDASVHPGEDASVRSREDASVRLGRTSTSTNILKGKRQGLNNRAKPTPLSQPPLQPWTAWAERFYETFAHEHPDHLPDDYRSKAGREKLIAKGADALRKLHDLRKVPKPEIGAILKYLLYEDDFYLPGGHMKTLHKIDQRTRDGDQRHYEVVRSKMKKRKPVPQVGIIPYRDAP